MDLWLNGRHKLNGPIKLLKYHLIGKWEERNFYYICGIRYDNFISYIRAVIKYKKDNNL